MSGETDAVAVDDDADRDYEPGLFDVDPQWFKLGFYLFLALWLVYILVETTSYTRFEDTFFPYVVGIPIAILLAIQFVAIRYPDLIDRVKPDDDAVGATSDDELQQRLAEATDRTARSKREREKYEIVMIGWVIVLPFMMFYLGLGWSLILYVFTFTWYFMRDLKTATVVTLIVVAFVQLLFLQFLDMIVLPGELGLPDPLVYLDDLINDII